MNNALGWTIDDAVGEFAKAGMPVDPKRFRIAVMKVACLPRIGEVRKPPGSAGGRGPGVYDIGELQLLHSRLADWIVIRDP